VMIAFYKKVFPVPPWPQTKKNPGVSFVAHRMIVS
jgi:hypothetical protein